MAGKNLALRIVFFAGSAVASANSAPIAQASSLARPNCSDAESDQLDFWIGEWIVYNTSDKVEYATSRVVPVMEGCGIQENYASPAAPGGAYYGTSYSGFDRKDGRWHQMYIDVKGNVTWYSGGLNGKDMEMTAPGKQGSIQKMVYKPFPDGSVEQVGTLSTDGGKTWQPGYDYTYRKSTKAAVSQRSADGPLRTFDTWQTCVAITRTLSSARGALASLLRRPSFPHGR